LSKHSYQIKHQFQRVLPRKIDYNEFFDTSRWPRQVSTRNGD
jgi:hypothetical protein